MSNKDLLEPRTIEALDTIIDIRNAANREEIIRDPNLIGLPQAQDILLRYAQSELARVEQDEPAVYYRVRDFLGGIGLITRRGFCDDLTDAGRAVLASTRPKKPARLKQAA